MKVGDKESIWRRVTKPGKLYPWYGDEKKNAQWENSKAFKGMPTTYFLQFMERQKSWIRNHDVRNHDIKIVSEE
jgi:hypothetical protein